MLATLPASDPPLVDPSLVYEPKYDGIRAIALVEPAKPRARVRFWSRLGNEKTTQFPELVAALAEWGRRLERPGRARRRDRRARRQGAAGRVSAAAEPHSRDGARLSIVEGRSCVRTNSRPRSSCSTCCARETRICARCRSPSGARGSRRSSRSTSRRRRACGCPSRWPATAARSTRARRKRAGRGCSSRRRARRIATASAVPEWRKLKITNRTSSSSAGGPSPRARAVTSDR